MVYIKLTHRRIVIIPGGLSHIISLRYNKLTFILSQWDNFPQSYYFAGGSSVAINLEKIRARLESERKRLKIELDDLQTNVEAAEVIREGSPFGKREEEATESFELEKRLALQKQVRSNLIEIEHVLEKFQNGTYGLCDNCGQPISPERLEAIPHANLCLNCKAKNVKNRPAAT